MDAASVECAPTVLTPLIGRDRERSVVADLLARHRLLTLTGPGGAGKSRLALAVAEAFPADRVVWVGLAAVADPQLVPRLLVESLGLPEPAGRSYVESVVTAIAESDVVLVLDTCEHLLQVVPELVEQLLAATDRLRVLATSQAPLHVDGEVTWTVPPLSCPAGGSPVADVRSFDAVVLFEQRALAVRPGFAVDDDNADAVVAICRRLDGNPLAIELAAARVRVLTPDQIAAALDDSIRLLAGRGRGRPARQQTLRAALDWSHRLLDEDESRLLAVLGVFVGGTTLDAVEAVAEPDLDAADVLDLLAGLVDKSLLGVAESDGTARYAMADPVRQYASARLDATGSGDRLRDRHLRWYLGLAELVDRDSGGREQYAGFDRLDVELPNLRAGFEWAMASGEHAAALRLATALAGFAAVRGHHREGRGLLDRALAGADEHDPAGTVIDRGTLARAYDAAGMLAFLQCDYRNATARLEAAAELYDAIGDERGTASVVQTLGSVLREQGDYPRAEELLEQSVARWTRLGDEGAAARCANRLAFTALLQGDHERARAGASRTLAVARRLGDNGAAVSALIVLGGAALAAGGELGVAEARLTEALADARAGRYVEGIAYADEGLGLVALSRRHLDDADRLLRDALRRQHRLGDRWRTASLLVDLAACERARGRLDRAVRLLGASDTLLEQIGGALPPVDRGTHDRARSASAATLQPEEYAAAWAAGQSAPLDNIVAELLDPSHPPTEIPRQRGSQPTAAAAATGDLTVVTLGQEEIRLDGRSLAPADFSYAKPRELLYLLLEAPSATKSDIGLALWPDTSSVELRSAFHTTLHHLRRAVGASRVRYRNGRYEVDRERLRYDVNEFATTLAAARAAADKHEEMRLLRAATDLYGGDYLPDTDPAWAAERRAELKHRFERALLALGRRLAEVGHHATAVEVLRRAVTSDPLMESAHRELMRAYAQLGEPSRAVRQYDTLAALLRDELGTSPAAETVHTYREIRLVASV